MKARHLFPDRYYLLTSKSVEGVQFFKEESDKLFFKKRIDKYLKGVCRIEKFILGKNQISMIVRLKSSEEIEAFYRDKHQEYKTEQFFMPCWSHIFSRQFSNLLVSYVKHYNWKYKRKGTLIRSRFSRQLIMNIDLLEKIRSGMDIYEVWEKTGKINLNLKSRESGIKLTKEMDGLGFEFGGNVGDARGQRIDRPMNSRKPDLRGHFKRPFKKDIIPAFHRKCILAHRLKFPFGPNIN